ncbi:MAG TPA: nucleoside-diphosphate sugar epimerase/dehydratase [Bryobacteraceae bacterium]|nr:nucleoside-diphosphate sugar epimerase/dehydratase [Bryobacteraceae bacterium]
MKLLIRTAKSLSRHHRPIALAVQLALIVAAGTLAFLLRFELEIPAAYRRHWQTALIVWALAKSLVFALAGLNRDWWRFACIYDLKRLAAGNLVGTLVSVAIILRVAPAGFPRSIYLLDLVLCFVVTLGARVAVRVIADFPTLNGNTQGKERTLIYGAGNAGVSLLDEIRQNPSLGYEIVGFADDDPQKAHLLIHGTKVLCSGASLGSTAKRHLIDTVLIAIPSASGAQIGDVLRRCHESGVSFKTIPSLGEVIVGRGLVTQIREVAAQDLLGRTPVRVAEAGIREKIHNRVVAVTGAAGSIGSELCRQIARFGPRSVIAYDIAETPLFELELEMKANFPAVPFCPEIGSIQNARRIREVLEHHRPSIVYHAAAYKHVPMMEGHIFEAVENNVLGTYGTALAAEQADVEDFVMISTDKAVRPTSVMGVTKRIAELAVNSMQNRTTRFVSVRFGNVLGSNGSVVQLFKRQIAAGGPLTVTHPGMQRYFMTIPEAAQLVLLASTAGRGGEIFVLDMGEPVKILDLANNLIRLSGLQPDKDIQIEITGARPGEKLYEELQLLEESTVPTRHDKIKTFVGPCLSYDEVRTHIQALRRICAARDVTELLLRIKDIVPEYNPSADMLRRALTEGNEPVDGRRRKSEMQYALRLSGHEATVQSGTLVGQ